LGNGYAKFIDKQLSLLTVWSFPILSGVTGSNSLPVSGSTESKTYCFIQKRLFDRLGWLAVRHDANWDFRLGTELLTFFSTQSS